MAALTHQSREWRITVEPSLGPEHTGLTREPRFLLLQYVTVADRRHQDYAADMTPRLLPALIFILAALPVQAQVYKWVDAKGQVNYSNAAPASAAGKTQVVEEQISVMGMDPAVRAYAERSYAERTRQNDADWQLRQRAMYTQASTPSYDSGYSGDYYPAYYGGYYGGAGYLRRPLHPLLNPNRPVLPPRVTHHSSRPGPRASAGDLRR